MSTVSSTMSAVRSAVWAIDDAYLIHAEHRRLMLIRHGAAERVAGDDPYDPSLSEAGRDQAEALASRLARTLDGGNVAVVSSPLRRTRETAEIVCEGLGLQRQPEIEPGLAEVGGLAAPTPVALPMERGAIPQFRWDVPDGPFRPAAVAGVRAALARTAAPVVVAITHGGVMNAYVSELLDLPGEFFLYPYPTSITEVRISEDRVALVRLNDVAHLEGAER
jgi:broad specificity phosphatase PhoE